MTPDVRLLARRGLNRGLGLMTSPLRAGLVPVARRNPALAARLAEWSWIWQPGWGRGWYENHFRSGADPDRYASNPYELRKYADIMAVIGDRHFARGLEIGSAEGTFTAELAPHCAELLGVDLSDLAVERARRALADQRHVRFERRTLPFDWPAGTYDLIVCSDVLYLWQPSVLAEGLRRLRESLAPGGLLVLQHFLGDFGQPVNGAELHDRVTDPAVGGPALRSVFSQVSPGCSPKSVTGGPGFRIDAFTLADSP